MLWRIPAKVTTSVETLSVESLLEGSPYRSEAVQQLLKLQAECNWERLTRAGYTLMQAVPLDRVGEEFKSYELPLSEFTERATGSDEGSDVEEILASGQVGNPLVPGTPPSPGVKQSLGRLSRDLARGREGASIGMKSPWGGALLKIGPGKRGGQRGRGQRGHLWRSTGLALRTWSLMDVVEYPRQGETRPTLMTIYLASWYLTPPPPCHLPYLYPSRLRRYHALNMKARISNSVLRQAKRPLPTS
jgi:hypothetical protein